MSSAVSDSPPSIAHGRAEFTWEIENFSTKIYRQQSPIFSFPANSKVRFVLDCYPSIDMAGQPGKFVALNLRLHPNSLEARNQFAKPYVRYRIAILKRNGTRNFSQECRHKFKYPYNTPLTSEFACWGCQIKRDHYFFENFLLNNDMLTVYCEVDDCCLKKSLAIPPNPIQDDFRSLLESGKYSDAVLLIDGKSLSVHKNILSARSEVFEAMFEHDLEEKKTNRVEISDVAVEVMELMLGYIYTGQIPELNDYAAELFVAADKYQLNALSNSCETHLLDNLTSSTAANILMIADMLQASDLKEACSAYITENVEQVMSTEGWKVLLTKSDLMGELFLKMANKQDVLNEKVKAVECELTVQKKSAENSFEEDIESLLDTGKLSDAFLVVGDVELPVHRNILCARSKVFADLFETQTRVQMDNISVEVCKELLCYIYTGQVGGLNSVNEFVPQLLEASHEYGLNHLKAKCEEFLSFFSWIDVDSVVDKFLLAESNEANHLKRFCFDFICENVKQVILTDGWKTLKQTRPEFTLELLEQVTEKKCSAVGLGNVWTLWRFPYLAYRNGGGSFFIPYTFSLVFLGLTFFLFESSLGQYTQLGPISLWRLSPIFKGVGYAMSLMGVYVGIYYNMVVAWSIYYLYASFTALPKLPWTYCNNTWNTDNCIEQRVNQTRQSSIEHKSKIRSPSQEYFFYHVLNRSDGIDQMGSLQGHLVLCLAIAWVLVFLCLMWGVKILGKVSYFTAIFPYVIITVMIVNGAMLDGASDGVLAYILPDFSTISSIDVWSDAATQILHSLCICRGSVITLASYNPFHNNTIRDSLFIVIFNSQTNVYAGFAIFIMIGFMARQIGKLFDEAADHGVGLAFVAYPAALSHLSVPWFWSAMFFLMLIILGFGSQLTIVVNLMEMWPSKLANRKAHVLVFKQIYLCDYVHFCFANVHWGK